MELDKEIEDEENNESSGGNDPYNVHFGSASSHLSDSTRTAVDKRKWTTTDRDLGKLGHACFLQPEGTNLPVYKSETGLVDKLQATFEDQLAKKSDPALCKELLGAIGSYQDLYMTKRELKTQSAYREVISLHILNHIMKKRRRVLKNNEKLSNLPKNSEPLDSNVLLDQGFVRPSILVVLPFRSSAYQWVNAFIQQIPGHQVENRARFNSEFTLPSGAEDKLLTAPAGSYPEDHIANMSGNIDDHFRMGIKVTRKSVKLFSDFYSSDIIVASPLGLRELIEKERSADYLSSIEILLIFDHINKIPKQSHDTDFSRVKPWYLDGHASYLRQSILLSTYETPEIRSLFNKNLLNVAGKQRILSAWPAAQVPEGIRQNFVQFECNNPQNEIDKRFEYFTTRLFPTLLKSAVQSVNTVIFIPSYFDYSRIRHWLKTQDSVTFTVLSEDSDNREISRARQAFYSGNKAMLLVTERFHFFRRWVLYTPKIDSLSHVVLRYKIRGIRNLVFYAPPDHPQFYTEFLSFPFLDDDVLAEDVTCKVLYSKYDYMRLERLVGTAEVRNLIAA
ncbi:rRNA-binding ribosome biosynthesis protein utp25 [Serendipita sp. 399]|nr:rRNA-binding ribosome biosynthesis protein utp25 [Serendipita sp. 399]